MRVHRSAGDNSLFLPLFTGRRDDRVARLVTQFRGGALRFAGGAP
jgi:hypothetical protein